MEHISFRLPVDILAKIRKSAEVNERSISAEILFRLKSTFKRS